jgi:hypothetical protein
MITLNSDKHFGLVVVDQRGHNSRQKGTGGTSRAIITTSHGTSFHTFNKPYLARLPYVGTTSYMITFLPMARQPLGGLGRLIFRGFTITKCDREAIFGRTPLDEGPARRRDLYLTTHNTHKRQTSMPPVGFEPTILLSKRPQTHALDRTATGIGI